MFSIRIVSAFAAAALLSMASAQDASSSKIVSIPTPTATLPANAMETIGCFETGVPLEDHGKGLFVTAGSCQQICLGLDKDVLGLSDGDHCWCGDEYPPKDSQVANSTCNTSCSGDDRTKCGGRGLLWVMSTGNSRNEVPYFKPQSSSSSSATPSTTSGTSRATSSSGPADSAVASGVAPEPEKKGPNTAGIAAGVVVGVLVLAAIIGGVFFFLRRQRKRAVEEEYRRQAAANSFISGGKLHTSNSSITDSRLDPEFMARRQSNGSIADNEDYSRRILKVTNA
ncbi:hypothetical protein BU23DRAFT_565251 [Bimuria novae-zelandiae CBS 107.79]|uniref:WSC domain-containing protein n=1 Tax=Bimuria novae-zelandiae CBS 107.79 TaxID=1447943 RepID=A0A6A5VHN6_9PLEO|nr:hypothetical protein BU23DRAFT_565251 [Bimuria novae-zelandiae CBS 107.79]